MNKYKNKKEEQTKLPMETEPVHILILKMAVPTIISMLITTVYNMTDTFYVGKIGSEAVAAVGIVYSYMSIIQAFGFLFGHGSGNYIAHKLGQHKGREAENMAGTALLLSGIFGVVLGIFSYLFAGKIVRILGAVNGMTSNAAVYLQALSFGIPFIIVALMLNNQLRFQGKTLLGMIGIGMGGILNIAMAPLFIFVLNMKVEGAGIATSLCQLISFLLLFYIARKKSVVHITIKRLQINANLIKELLWGGMPNFTRQAIASFAMLCLNLSIIRYGEQVIAAFTIVNRWLMMTGAAMIGLGQGFQPVCAYNYGAKLYKRVKAGFKFCCTVSTVAAILLTGVCYLFSDEIVRIFTVDSGVISVGKQILRYQCISVPVLGWVIMSGMLLQNTGRYKQATIVSASRQGIVFLPVLGIMVYLGSLKGILLVQPLADIGTFLISLPMGIRVLKFLNGMD
ncbi:MATE family efflux transporter [Anaerocolumna sp. MB42-C2]|uniref:MATE family efflux transporter n=1 Tax=Anaerocolumna sp. MB42-C2 TaxID=3070997 RepID=UPI0027E1AE31|nr:MATE family efflux transporter [Anaerocolumna sp. MB42-C2]WMJ86938.1 MATE family efflux transporter [Anaerocolumna sp. MB42-C2]